MKRAITLALLAFFFLFLIEPNLKAFKPVEYKIPIQSETLKTNSQATEKQSSSKARIVLDLGTVLQGDRQSEILWQIAQKTASKLADAGYCVFFDEEKEALASLDDAQRLAAVKALEPDYVLQLRLNESQDPSRKGYALFVKNKEEQIALADAISREIGRIDFSNYLGLDSDHYGNFVLLKEEDLPAVLIQLGYLSNEEEAAKLSNESYQQALADALTNAFLTIIN